MSFQHIMSYFFGEDLARPLLQAFVQQQHNNNIITPRLHAVLRRKIILISTPPDNHTDQPLTWTTKRVSGKG